LVAARQNHRSDPLNTTERVNILLVDDQPGKLLSLEAILQELGENLIKANSGKEALELLLRNEFAAILLDVSMPEMDGFEVAELIRQHPRFQKTPVIFISAVHLTDLDQMKGYQRGAVDYISVPVNPELLRAKVSVFVELHRSASKLEDLNQELQELSNSLMTTQDAERRRIARELHDGLAQDLTAAKMMLDTVAGKIRLQQSERQVLGEVSSLLSMSMRHVRSMSYLLHPPLLDEVGLGSAMRWYLDGFGKRSSIATSLALEPPVFPRLTTDLETAVFRILQEALVNVLHHARATAVHVSLTAKDGQLLLTIQDNGRGISDEVIGFRASSIGVGLSGMMQRARELGGTLELSNARPGGVVQFKVADSGHREPTFQRKPVT